MALEGIEDRWALFDTVPTIVDEKFEDGRELSIDALRVANENMAAIKEIPDAVTLESVAISEDVETAMFERETERAELLLNDALDGINDDWSKHGFTLPNANLLAARSIARTDYMHKRLDVSRDIAIKNWELTDANIKFAVKLTADLKMEAAKAIGAINAQIVAGAFSSVSASVQMSAQNSASYQYSSNPSY